MKRFAPCLVAALIIAGCGGGGGPAKTRSSAPKVNQAEVTSAVSVITRRCIEQSFGNAGGNETGAVGTAVDRLIRNFNAGPDSPVTTDLKARTMRGVLEAIVGFLHRCSPSDEQRVHTALTSR